MGKNFVCLLVISQLSWAQTSQVVGLPDWAPYIFVSAQNDTIFQWSLEGAVIFGGLCHARFVAVDPLGDRFTRWSPYAYGQNDPTIFVDPTGRAPEVYITGQDAVQATRELDKATSIRIERNPKTGKLSASGEAKTDFDRKILEAINDEKVVVHVTTTRENSYISIDGTSQPLIVGAFDGSRVGSDGKVNAFQVVNVGHAQVWQSVGGGTVGQTIGHEVNESFIGGQLSPGSFYSSAAFKLAHEAASQIDPPQGIVSVEPIHAGDATIIRITGPIGSAILYQIKAE